MGKINQTNIMVELVCEQFISTTENIFDTKTTVVWVLMKMRL